ncbi:hypothetical protein [Streptomyces sp. NPDC048845]|uniref:SCO2583 family membrane protein n=1 Tax=Streptomyces sp. NPDC048845 TaxID=3155390 RepID=UPI0034193A45
MPALLKLRVRAARLQEFSAQERLDDHTPAVRRQGPWRRSRGSRQALVLVLLIALAFATAVYMGVRNPYRSLAERDPEPLRSTVVPLAPRGAVPGAAPAALFEHSPAAHFRVGAEGVNLPAVHGTENFTDTQVLAALDAAKEYIIRSSLDPEVLTGGTVRPVRVLVDSYQLEQFDRSMDRPADDGRHAATGWLVRFDASRVALADPQVRVRGSLAVTETGSSRLEVTGDHTFVYALRPAAGQPEGDGQASLFTVRREVRFRFDRDDLRDHQIEVVQAYVQAGPMSCGGDTAGQLRPLLAGQDAGKGRPAGTDPYAPQRSTASLCGVMADEAQPSPPRGSP